MQEKIHETYRLSAAELIVVTYRRQEAWNSNNGKPPLHGNTGHVAKNRLPDAVRNKILEPAGTVYRQFPLHLFFVCNRIRKEFQCAVEIVIFRDGAVFDFQRFFCRAAVLRL